MQTKKLIFSERLNVKLVEIKLCDWFGQMLSNFVRSQIQVVIDTLDE